MIKEKFPHLPKDKRKKILLICDDIRVHSGIATVAREIVLQTAHHFNWVNIAGAITHPEKGQRLDLSQSTNEIAGIDDSSVIAYPVDGYGDAELIRYMMKMEKPDAVLLITDPRYFVWLFQIENEIRKHIPIAYLNIWDDLPAPHYNKAFYESCDLLMGISKQTKNINKLVLGEKANTRILKYVPHGINHNIFKPLDKKDQALVDFKKKLFKGKEYDFALLFNSRNIRRKQIPDTILAYRYFIDGLPLEKAKKCCLVLHTERANEHGTDLDAVIELLANGEQYNIIFTDDRFDPIQMNLLYNSTDAQILLTSNEGWGLSITEAIMAGNLIIANVTGGMQDQMRFEFEDGSWIDFDENFPSNHNGTYKKHGEWAFPVYPASRTLVGSIPTPYIWDDTCKSEDAAEQIKNVYELSYEERKAKGIKGREWAISDEAGFTSEKQGERVIEAFDELFSTWKPRESYQFIDVNKVADRIVNHKLQY